MKYDIVALGECLIDFTPQAGFEAGVPVYAQNPGGAPANVLAMASKLGCSTAFIGKVGKDSFGSFLKAKLEESGIDCTGLVVDPRCLTSLAFVTLDGKGDRDFSFYRNATADVMLKEEDVNRDLISASCIFHFGSVSMTDEPSRTATLAALKMAKECGCIISFDPNFRPFLWDDEKSASLLMTSVLPYCDILKVSYEEMQLMSEEDDLDLGSKKLHERGPVVVIVTLGAKGAFIRVGEYTKSFEAYNVATIDTTGAGDAFLGAFLYQIVHGSFLSRASLAMMPHEKIDEFLLFANAAGSLATTDKGAIPALPDKDDIFNCMRNCSFLKRS